MEAEIPDTTAWIGKTGDSNPQNGQVLQLVQEQSKNGKLEWVLYIATSDGTRKASLWGENMERCKAKWGKLPSKWVGQRVQVLTEEKIGEKRKRFILPL